MYIDSSEYSVDEVASHDYNIDINAYNENKLYPNGMVQ